MQHYVWNNGYLCYGCFMSSGPLFMLFSAMSKRAYAYSANTNRARTAHKQRVTFTSAAICLRRNSARSIRTDESRYRLAGMTPDGWRNS
jgi:hypothetical protein